MKKNSTNTSISRIALPSFALICATASFAQYNPDPDIFDASKNGVSSGNGNDDGSWKGLDPSQQPGSPIGGSINVVNESQLPSLEQIALDQIGANSNGLNIPGLGGRGSMSSSGSSSSGGGGIPMMGGGGGGGGGQSSPFPMPPQSQSSSGGGQEGSQGMPPPGAQSGEGGQGSEGPVPPGAKGDPISGNFPPPPPDMPIGDQSQTVGAQQGESENPSGSEGQSGQSQSQNSNSSNSSKQSGGSQQSEGSQESDGQEMPDDIGGQGGSGRGSGGAEEGAKMSSGL